MGNDNTGAKSASPREPEFQKMLKKLSGINARLTELSAIAEAACDRIVGPEPEQHLGNPKIDSLSNGCLADLAKALDEASATTERVYRYVIRITTEF